MAKKAKTRRELQQLRSAAARRGGLARTKAKAKAARENGKLGGRPIAPLPKFLPTPEFASKMVLGLEAAARAFDEAAVWLARYVAAS